MMKKYMLIGFLLMFYAPAYATSLLEKIEKDEISRIPNDDPAMAKAMIHAKSTLDEFLTLKSNPTDTQSNFAIKIGISDAGGTEFFWVGDFKATTRDTYIGILDNEPRLVKNVKMGQEINFKKEDIVDWVYVEDDKMKGNFTACALLEREPVAEQENFKRVYGLDCNL